MSSRRPLGSVRESAFVGLQTSMTVEEVDCDRRGYKLTKTVLGTGAYAKVKLAYVMENKIEKDRRLAEDLHEKGHNMVGKLSASSSHLFPTPVCTIIRCCLDSLSFYACIKLQKLPENIPATNQLVRPFNQSGSIIFLP